MPLQICGCPEPVVVREIRIQDLQRLLDVLLFRCTLTLSFFVRGGSGGNGEKFFIGVHHITPLSFLLKNSLRLAMLTRTLPDLAACILTDLIYPLLISLQIVQRLMP